MNSRSPKTRLTPTSFAKMASERWTDRSASPFLHGIMGDVEANVHELAHAAVFGIDPFFPWLTTEFSGVIAEQFGDFESNFASDMSECRALAVERLVLRKLGWLKRIRWASVMRFAQDEMQYVAPHVTKAAVAKFERTRIARRRAKRVIVWMNQAVKEGDHEEHDKD